LVVQLLQQGTPGSSSSILQLLMQVVSRDMVSYITIGVELSFPVPIAACMPHVKAVQALLQQQQLLRVCQAVVVGMWVCKCAA
jgi:hypothetical protein